MNERVTFSMDEIKRVYVLQQVEERKLSGREACLPPLPFNRALEARDLLKDQFETNSRHPSGKLSGIPSFHAAPWEKSDPPARRNTRIGDHVRS